MVQFCKLCESLGGGEKSELKIENFTEAINHAKVHYRQIFFSCVTVSLQDVLAQCFSLIASEVITQNDAAGSKNIDPQNSDFR